MPAGRILEEALVLFKLAGIDLSPVIEAKKNRRLIVPLEKERLRVLIVRDTDVPAYVEYGAADFGIAGRDVLEEQGRDLYEPVDLGIGRCRMSVAEPADRPVDDAAHIHLRYATKFPEITRRHLQSRGTVAEIIKLYGSIEIAPLVGLADRIVDLVSSRRDPAPAQPARGGDHHGCQRLPVRGPGLGQACDEPHRRHRPAAGEGQGPRGGRGDLGRPRPQAR